MFAALGIHSFPTTNGEQLCHARNLSRVLCPQSIPSAEDDGVEEETNRSQIDDPKLQISKRIIQISVKRDPDGSLGFTLCGGAHPENSALGRPLYISHIRRGGPVHREGSIRPGDRLLAVDGHSLEESSLAEAQLLLQQHCHCEKWKDGEGNIDCSQGNHACCVGDCYTLLVTEYDVVQRKGLSELRRPLLVELQLDHPDEELGLSLAMIPEDSAFLPQKRSAALIEAVRPASIAERCGALHAGDILLSIGRFHHKDSDWKRDGSFVSRMDSVTTNQSVIIHIEVLPLSQMDRPSQNTNSDCESNESKQGAFDRQVPVVDLLHSGDSYGGDVVSQSQCDMSSNSSSGSLVWNTNVSQRWTQPPPLLPRKDSTLSPRQLVGCDSSEIHDGTCEEISNLEAFLQSTNFRDSNDSEKMILWQNKGPIPYDTFDMECAHDRLKPIPWFSPNNENLQERQSSGDGVEIDSSRGNDISNFPPSPFSDVKDGVIHLVQVARNGGPLGITLSGTEDPSEHIIISGLVEGGPARCTSSLQVGDRLLAVGGEPVTGRPLSEAVALLRAASDPVLLHVARSPDLSQDQSFTRNRLNNAKTQSCDLEIEESFIPRFSNAIDEIGAETDDAIHIPAVDIINPPATMCSCPAANCHSPASHCTSNHNLATTGLNSSLIYELNPKSSPNLSSSLIGTVGCSRRCQSIQPAHSETLHFTLYKDGIYEDFGFSVSDGLYERGVYINRIRKGGPADIASLKPFDRIIQVNDTITYAFDCCLTVPLIASSGDKMQLTIVRYRVTETKNISY